MRLFAYGTLEYAPLVFKLVRHRFRITSAVLNGYACYYLRGKNFPGIVKKRGAHVKGTLCSGLSYRDFKRIDKYEDDYYQRCLLNIEAANNKIRQAYVYVVTPSKSARLSKRLWRRINRRECKRPSRACLT